jgi:hypothetical protein
VKFAGIPVTSISAVISKNTSLVERASPVPVTFTLASASIDESPITGCNKKLGN